MKHSRLFLIPGGGQFLEPVGRGSLVLQPVEGSERSVQPRLGLVQGGFGSPGFRICGGSALHARERHLHLIDCERLREFCAHGNTLRTVAHGRAAIDGVSPVVRAGDNHPGSAGPAAENTEAGKEAVGPGPAPSLPPLVLDELPKVPVHDGLMGVEVHQFSEVDFPDDETGGE